MDFANKTGSSSCQHTSMSLASPVPKPLDDHIQEFEWLRVVESVLADREQTEREITQQELDDLIPTLDNLEISTDEEDEISFGDYLHFSPTKTSFSPLTIPRSIPSLSIGVLREEGTPVRGRGESRKPGSFSPLEVTSPLVIKRDTNGGTPRKRPTRIPVLRSRLKSEQAFRSLRNTPVSKFHVFEDSSETDTEPSAVQIIQLDSTPSISPPSTPQLGFAANVTQPLTRNRTEGLYNEPRSPGRVCSPIRREINLKPSLRVSGTQPSSSKLISSLQSALTGSEVLGFYTASDLRARLGGKESGRKRRSRRKGVKWAEELEW